MQPINPNVEQFIRKVNGDYNEFIENPIPNMYGHTIKEITQDIQKEIDDRRQRSGVLSKCIKGAYYATAAITAVVFATIIVKAFFVAAPLTYLTQAAPIAMAYSLCFLFARHLYKRDQVVREKFVNRNVQDEVIHVKYMNVVTSLKEWFDRAGLLTKDLSDLKAKLPGQLNKTENEKLHPILSKVNSAVEAINNFMKDINSLPKPFRALIITAKS